MVQSIYQREIARAEQLLDQIDKDPNTPDFGKVLISKLQAILAGSRDLTLADDPALAYNDAVELRLLLEELGSGS